MEKINSLFEPDVETEETDFSKESIKARTEKWISGRSELHDGDLLDSSQTYADEVLEQQADFAEKLIDRLIIQTP